MGRLDSEQADGIRQDFVGLPRRVDVHELVARNQMLRLRVGIDEALLHLGVVVELGSLRPRPSTLGGDFEHDAGVLAAASVSASGMSAGGQDNRMTGHNIVLTLVVKDEYAEEAARILEDAGALI